MKKKVFEDLNGDRFKVKVDEDGDLLVVDADEEEGRILLVVNGADIDAFIAQIVGQRAKVIEKQMDKAMHES